jgi:hypothetical protein
VNADTNLFDAVGAATAIAGTSFDIVGIVVVINNDANVADDANVANDADVADIAANEVGAASKLVPPKKA